MPANTEPTTTGCADTGCASGTVLPVGPFVANNYHFGMLLGVPDLETDQGYHRGKTWLHQSWLHGAGVAWGLDVTIDPAHRELKVGPGLAVAASGREAYLDREYCVDIGEWFQQRRPEDLEVEARADGASIFTAHITITENICLDRPVPAISEPCTNGDFDTAYSRTVENALLSIEPNAAPAPVDLYPAVRQLLGLLPPTDPEVAAALAEIASAAEAERPARRLAWLRSFAASDVTALHPVPPAAAPFAAGPGAAVVLAQVRVVLLPDGGGRTKITDTGPDATTVNIRVRPAHLATAAITELAAGTGGRSGAPDGAARLDPGTLALTDTELTVAATAPLEPGTVGPGSISVTVLDGGAWTILAPAGVALDADGVTVTVTLAAAVAARPLRLVISGTGPAPVMGADGLPLAGVLGHPSNPPDTGTDAVLMVRSQP